MRNVSISLITLFFLVVTSVAFSEPDISILWEKDIALTGRKIKPYTIKVDEDKNIVRVVGESYIYKPKESPRKQKPELFEYRFNLKDNTAELKTLMAMDEGGIAISLPLEVRDSRLSDSNTVMILSRLIPQQQHESFNYQELTIGSDWQVKTREIPGPRSQSYGLGACRNINGDVFHCGNSGYIRKVRSDGNVAWDVNYKSDKGYENAFNVAFSESDKMLVAFGCSFESFTQLTTKDSSLWLANLDSKGSIRAKSEFEGIAFFAIPSFCLSKSENPIVIYDTNEGKSTYNIYASKFSKDLKTKKWTTHIFDGNDIMMSRMVLTPFKEDDTLATFTTLDTSVKRGHRNLHFYILDKNGSIINQATFKDVMGGDSLVTAIKDKIFYMANISRRKEEGDNTEYVRLICFKISPCKG